MRERAAAVRHDCPDDAEQRCPRGHRHPADENVAGIHLAGFIERQHDLRLAGDDAGRARMAGDHGGVARRHEPDPEELGDQRINRRVRRWRRADHGRRLHLRLSCELALPLPRQRVHVRGRRAPSDVTDLVEGEIEH